MVCTRCAHNQEIARLREICTKCRLSEDGRSGGTVSLDNVNEKTDDLFLQVAPEFSLHVKFNPDEIDEKPLDIDAPEMEAARRLIYALTSLSPIQALLLLHIAQGGDFVSFGAAVNDACEKAKAYKGGKMSKQAAFNMYCSICSRFPIFKTLKLRTKRFKWYGDA